MGLKEQSEGPGMHKRPGLARVTKILLLTGSFDRFGLIYFMFSFEWVFINPYIIQRWMDKRSDGT